MRMQQLLVTSAFAVGLLGCHPGGHVSGRVTECDPSENGARPCANLLPVGWEGFTTQQQFRDLVWRLGLIDNIAHAPAIEASRKGRTTCDDPGNRQVVSYFAPAALDELPEKGTNGRWLLAAVFRSARPGNGCADAIYGTAPDGLLIKRPWQFVAIRTLPLPAGTGKVAIGEWKSVAITRNQGNVLSLVTLATGTFYSCNRGGTPYPEPFEFMSCDAAHPAVADGVREVPGLRLASTGVAQASPLAVMHAALGLEAPRPMADLTLVDAMSARVLRSDAPAWGRCGNLGCCASEL